MSRRALLKRISISLVVGLVLGAVISEVTFIFLQETARPPQEIELLIPLGTAERVGRGEQPPSIPASMSFVVGDTLVVKNEDEVDHQLGPMWIPAGASARLQLSTVESYAFSCSFRPTKFMGLDVNEPLTWNTRLGGILFTGLPLGVLLALYSVILSPKRKSGHEE
jgi:hypothetical protein